MLNLDSVHSMCQVAHADASSYNIINKETAIYNSSYEFCCVRAIHALFPLNKPLVLLNISSHGTPTLQGLRTHKNFPMKMETDQYTQSENDVLRL